MWSASASATYQKEAKEDFEDCNFRRRGSSGSKEENPEEMKEGRGTVIQSNSGSTKLKLSNHWLNGYKKGT